MNSPDAPASPLLQFLDNLDHRLAHLEQLIASNARAIAATTAIIADMQSTQAQSVKHVEQVVGSVLKLAQHLDSEQEQRHRIVQMLLHQAEREQQVLESLSTAQERQAELLCQLVSLTQENQTVL